MIPTVIVGAIFFGIIIWALKRTRNDMKNNTCGGCSGTCSAAQKAKCHK